MMVGKRKNCRKVGGCVGGVSEFEFVFARVAREFVIAMVVK